MIATGSNAVATASHKEKKPSRLWRKGLISLEFLAPRPGLEPGTYGLTVCAICHLHVLMRVATIHINQRLRLNISP